MRRFTFLYIFFQKPSVFNALPPLALHMGTEEKGRSLLGSRCRSCSAEPLDPWEALLKLESPGVRVEECDVQSPEVSATRKERAAWREMGPVRATFGWRDEEEGWDDG